MLLPIQAQGATQGALEEQLRVRTAEVQSAREEATRLRTALVDAELELQRVTSREPAKRRSEQVLPCRCLQSIRSHILCISIHL